jgi:hypothetical protein
MTFTQGPIAVAEHESLWRYVPLHTFFLHLQGKVFLPTIATLQRDDIREGVQAFDHIVATVGFTEEERSQLWSWVRNRRLSEFDRKSFDDNQRHPSANQKLYFGHYYKTLRRSRFAWCWFKSEHESAAMWSFYGNKGVAIRTSLHRLQAALDRCKRKWLVSGMKYVDFRTLNQETFLKSETDKHWVRRPYLLKGMEYVHENEVRLVAVGGEKSQGIELEGIKPQEWMDQVLFWPDMPGSCVEAIKSTVEQLHPALKGRLGESGLYSFGQDIEMPTNSESAYNKFEDDYSDDEIKHWPAVLRTP